MHHLLLQISSILPTTSDLYHQGPLSTCLIAAIIYFYRKNNQQDATMEAMREKHEVDMKAAADNLQTYTQQVQKEVLTALNNSSQAIQDSTEAIKEIKLLINAKS